VTHDVIVLGSGQAGVPLAARLAESGKRVLLAERGQLGGTCINTGCTPTKTMVASARAAHVARTAGRLGVQAGPVRVDLAAVVRRKDEIVRQWREGVQSSISGAGERLTFVQGHARFVGERTVEVAGQRHQAGAVVINVGARPAVPPVPGLDQVRWLDNRRVMELTSVPEHLVVLGGGYIGCEMGQLFRRFGARVTIVEHSPHLLAREDVPVSAALEEVFRNEGIELLLGMKATRASAAGAGVRVELDGGRTVEGSHLLVATGRRPNTDDLGADAAGVRLDARGFVTVDDHYRTSTAGVYAVGDVNGGPQFTHVSWDDHRRLFEVMAGRPIDVRPHRIVPSAVFTDPQVAGVGLTEREAKAQGIAFELAEMPFGNVARAVELDEPAGVLRVLIDPASEQILGASIVGLEAGEMIHIFVVLMQARASARAIVDSMAAHPTLAEGVQSVVMKLDRFALRSA
jgi:pyruvate/2-oxoglutarate dehydrogenase complex dihydrolipoamide dehydrogenase (E3) component